MARLTPRFSADRTVREYTEQHYLPAAKSYHQRAADKGATGKQMVEGRQVLTEKWATLRFGEVKIETIGDQHRFEVQVHLDGLDPHAVRVELYANGVPGGVGERREMQLFRQLDGESGGYVYGAAVSATRPGSGLYGANDSALGWCCDPTGRRPSPLAAIIEIWKMP